MGMARARANSNDATTGVGVGRLYSRSNKIQRLQFDASLLDCTIGAENDTILCNSKYDLLSCL